MGRHRAAAAHLVAGQRVVAALEPRRQVPRVCRLARHRRREEEGRADLAAQPRAAARRRRSATSRAASPTSSGRPTARASRLSPTIRIRTTSRRKGRLEAEDRAADRDRPLSLQGRTATAISKHLYSHIAVFDVATKTPTVITSGKTDDAARRGRRMASRLRFSASAGTPIRIARRTRTSGSSRRARARSRGRSPGRRKAKAAGRRGARMAAASPCCLATSTSTAPTT